MFASFGGATSVVGGGFIVSDTGCSAASVLVPSPDCASVATVPLVDAEGGGCGI